MGQGNHGDQTNGATNGLTDAEPELTPARLRARRRALGLSQRALAQMLGVSANTLARWEQGQRGVGNPSMLRLALERL